MFALLRRIIRTLFLCSCNARYIWVVPSSSAVLETVYRYENERRRTSLTALNRHRHSFLRAAAMQTRISCEPDVRPSVKRVDCDKTKESSVQIFIPYERKFILVFRHEE